ncbi:MAG: DUF1800 domain-containing protein [Chloroflexi bacterium]|nr:DUF1800 domain-containing protein [Chloroflexota bacterium]
MPAATRSNQWIRIRSGRRGLFRVAGAAGLAAALAAACDGESKPGQPGVAGVGSPAAPAPEPAFPDDQRVRVQHLLRRAGFAPSETEVQRALGMSMDALIDSLVNPERTADPLDPALETLDMGDDPRPEPLIGWWLRRMTATARPSLEKMTLFWHGWHTSGFDKVGARRANLLYNQNVFQRGNAFGGFSPILKGISRQPAMMFYLDTQTNVRGRPNENYARELMELFSMGVGNYTEADVREAARAFTGYSLAQGGGEFQFRASLHDSGTKTVLGRAGALTGDDVVDIIMQQPATPKYVARKVWTSFAYPEPDEQTLAPVAKAFTDSGGDMRMVMRAVFAHAAFMSGPAYRALVKGSVEYAAGAVRSLGLAVDERRLSNWTRLMGQSLFNPPNVAGWPGGAAWMGSGAFLARLNGANTLLLGGEMAPPANNRGGNARPRNPNQQRPAVAATFDVDRYLDANKLATAGALVDHLALLLVDGRIPSAARTALVDYASGSAGDTASLSAMPSATRAARVQGTAYLLMAGPEYQLA